MTRCAVIGVDGGNLIIVCIWMAGVATWRARQTGMGRAMMGAMAVHAVPAGDAGLQRRRRAIVAVGAGALMDLANDAGTGVADQALGRMLDGGMVAAARMP